MSVRRLLAVLVSAALMGLFVGCRKNANSDSQPYIAVSNSYLYAAVRDLCPDQQHILSLIPPGMCPGHFDISPSLVNQLCRCRFLFVFDFQQNIEPAIGRMKDRGLRVCTITPPPGMCMADTYLSVVRQVADSLTRYNPQEKTVYEERYRQIEARINEWAQQVFDRTTGGDCNGVPVIVSVHQKTFAEWLGLDVVSAFAGRDTVTPAQINQNLNHARENHIRLVIANQQEGTELAQSLADHLNAGLVVFTNFPEVVEDTNRPQRFEQMVNANLMRLRQGLRE